MLIKADHCSCSLVGIHANSNSTLWVSNCVNQDRKLFFVYQLATEGKTGTVLWCENFPTWS